VPELTFHARFNEDELVEVGQSMETLFDLTLDYDLPPALRRLLDILDEAITDALVPENVRA